MLWNVGQSFNKLRVYLNASQEDVLVQKLVVIMQ